MSFDPDCYDLGEKFLELEMPGATEADKNDLAQTIQDAIELWLFGKEAHPGEGQDRVRGGTNDDSGA